MRTLTKKDIVQDISWLVAPIICFTHEAIDNIALERIKTFAIFNKTIVLRWRLLTCDTISGNFDVSDLTDESASNYVGLWAFYVTGLPVRIQTNINIAARVVNGTLGVLTGIVPTNPLELRKIYNNTEYNPGDIITIPQPHGVFIKCENTSDKFNEIFLLQGTAIKGIKHNKSKKIQSIPIIMEGINLNINVILPGFESTLVTTDYAGEGHTMDKVIVDLNYYPNRQPRLENVTVSLT